MPNCNHSCDRFRKLSNLTWGEFSIDDADVEASANDRGGISYGNFDRLSGSKAGREWFAVDYCGGSDYVGDLATKSNYRSLMKLCKEALQDADTCQEPWFVELYGGHGTFGIVLHCARTPTDIYDVIYQLNNYPLVDEDDYSELQHDEEGEAWVNWASHDFNRALENKFPTYDFDEISGDDLYKLFHTAAEDSNTYWETDGMSMHIKIDRVVDNIELSDLPPKKGWKVADDLDGLRPRQRSGRMTVPAWVRRRR